MQPTLGSDTRETHGGSGMQPKGFVDCGFEVWKVFNDFRVCDWVVIVSESFVELFL